MKIFTKRCGQLLTFSTVVLAATFGMTAPRAAELTEPVLLVASSTLDGSLYQQAVVIAAPLPGGGHIGLIVNHPTTIKLDAMFPDEAAAKNVTEPVYLGGPHLMPGLFAITRKAPEGGTVVSVGSGLNAVLDGTSVDRILASTPNDARYFLGLVLWEPGELEGEVSNSVWEVQAADAEAILRARTSGLWNSLRRPMAALGANRSAGGA
jgi:putative transcriptional regulator